MELSAADVAYVRANFVPLAEVAAGRDENVPDLVRRGLLPRPTYVLPDGTEMVPHDYLALADEAGGAERLPAEFARRCTALGLDAGEEWEAYLSGEYGVCLREVTPETIARKTALVSSITGLLDDPRPEDDRWRERLRTDVDALDALEREFSPDYDRSGRFPLPPTRDRLIRAARERFAEVFAAVEI
jgi:Family of unknown function (DUF6058)